MPAETAVSSQLPRDADGRLSRDAAWWRPGRSWVPAAAAALIAGVVFAFARDTLIDDAYITLDYARSLAFHLQWGLIPAATSNTATSALNVLVLALFTVVTHNAVVALGIVLVLSTVALEVGLRVAARAYGLPGWLGLLSVALVSVNPLLISSIGLEVALGAGLGGLLVAAAATHRPVWFGVLAGLLLLTRPDLLIVVLVVFFGQRRWYRGWWRPLAAAVVVTAPWYVWSWLALGSAVPATLVIKTAEKSWGSYQFSNGPLLYDAAYPVPTVLSFLPMALGLLTALLWLALRVTRPSDRLRRLDRLAALPLAGALYYLAYTALGVPPYHWYYGPSIVWTTVFLAAAVAAPWTPTATTSVVSVVSRGFGAVLVAALLVASVWDYGSGGLPRTQAQITTNWATPGDYATMGAAVGRLAGNRTVASFGEIGAMAYFCDCSMIDEFSDPGAVAGLVNQRIAATHGLRRKLIGWNFHFLDHTRRPVVAQLALVYTGKPVPGALGSWPVTSAWQGPHYVSLVRNR